MSRPSLLRFSLVLALLIALVWVAPAPAATAPQLDAEAWILIDSRDGEVLAADDENEERLIASATKMMTAWVALRELNLSDITRAPRYRGEPVESLMGLEPGELISVRDLLYGLILASGNDAAVALARAAAGNVPDFVAMMNSEAARLGLKHTHYANPIGLDAPGNYSTAADLAELGRQLMELPDFRRIATRRQVILRSVQPNRRLVTRNTLLFALPWANGIKTGHTIKAGYVLVGSGRRDRVELIAAVLGTDSIAARDAETAALLSYGMSLYRPERVLRAGETVRRPDIRFSGGRLPLLASRGFEIRHREDQRLALRVRAPREVEGPLREGQVLGRAVVRLDGRRIASIPLRAGAAVPAPTTWERVSHWSYFYVIVSFSVLFVILITAALIRRGRRDHPRRGPGKRARN